MIQRVGRLLLGLLLISTSSVTVAVKDSAWHNGIETPNVDLPMYWGDMPNIYEDLGNFTNLYVQYHSCAWNQLGGYGDQEDTGKDVEENDYWYMGAMNSGVGWSYAPQVAFSLYGTLKGSRRKGCNSHTYINSFYTTSGFYAFSNQIASAGIANNGNSFSIYCQSGVGMSCSSTNNGFVFTKYSDNYCTRGNEESEGVSDELAQFNSALNEAKCVEIYDADSGNLPYLMFHSRSCELHDEVGACPDPHGRKSYYERRLSRALSGLAPDDEKFHKQMVKGYTMLGLGGFFVSMALILAAYEKFYGPRKVVLKTKTLDDDADTVDIEALSTSPTVELPVVKEKQKQLPIQDFPSIDEAPTDEGPRTATATNTVAAAQSKSFEQPAAAPSSSFEPGMFKCGDQKNLNDAQATLDSVLDQVEDAVAGASMECTSEEKILACVQVALDGRASEIECSAAPDDDVSIAAKPSATDVDQKKTFGSIPAVQSALSLISKASKTGETTAEAKSNKKKEKKQKESKTIVTDLDKPVTGSVKAEAAPVSPRSDALKKKLKFWKGKLAL